MFIPSTIPSFTLGQPSQRQQEKRKISPSPKDPNHPLLLCRLLPLFPAFQRPRSLLLTLILQVLFYTDLLSSCTPYPGLDYGKTGFLFKSVFFPSMLFSLTCTWPLPPVLFSNFSSFLYSTSSLIFILGDFSFHTDKTTELLSVHFLSHLFYLTRSSRCTVTLTKILDVTEHLWVSVTLKAKADIRAATRCEPE